MRLLPLTFVLLGAALSSNLALADDKAACISANENAQKLKDEQHLLAARDAYRLCARDACPAAIRKDCGESFEALEKLVPTVVVRVRRASGEDVVTASLKVDDQPTPLEGKPIALDPGRHKLRVIVDDQTKVVDVMAAQGERDRVIVVTMDPSASDPPPPVQPAARPEMVPAKPFNTTKAIVGTSMLVLGVGALAYGVAAFVQDVSETSKFTNEGSGLKTCDADASGLPASANAVMILGSPLNPCHVTDSAGQTYANRANLFFIQGVVSGVVGVALAATGTVLLVTSASSPAHPATARLYPMLGPSQGGLGVVGSF